MVTPLGVLNFWVIYIVSQINMYMEFEDSVLNAHWTWSRNIRIYVTGTRLNGDVCSHVSIMRLERHKYIPRNMHTVFALLCFVVVIHWLIFPYPSGLLHWHCGNLTIATVPAKQPWWIWINTSCEFIMNDYITTTKQSTTKPCAYFLGYTVLWGSFLCILCVSMRQCHALSLIKVTYLDASGLNSEDASAPFCVSIPCAEFAQYHESGITFVSFARCFNQNWHEVMGTICRHYCLR